MLTVKDAANLAGKLKAKLGQPSPAKGDEAKLEEAAKIVKAAAGRRPDFPTGKDYVDSVRGHSIAQPVTAEKLADMLRDDAENPIPFDSWLSQAERILKAFPSLRSEGRLTRYTLDSPEVQAILIT